MIKSILLGLLLFGAIVTFFPGSVLAGSMPPAGPNVFYNTMANQDFTVIGSQENPARSNFSSGTSVLMLLAGFWVLLALMKVWLRLGAGIGNRFA